MRKILVSVLAVFGAMQAFAAPRASIEEVRKEVFESIGACDQAVFSNDQYLAVSLRPLVPRVGHVRVYSLQNSNQVFDISTSARVTDVKIEGNTAYVLTGVTIEAWDIPNEKLIFQYASHPAAHLEANLGLDWRQQAQGFVLSRNRAIISHGTLGVSVIDLKNGDLIKALPMPTVSSAQDIALVNSDQAVLAIDNNGEGTFRGMYLMNLKTLEFTQQIKVDNAVPQAVRVLDGDRLMLVYSNAVWKFGKTQALAAKEPKPSRRAWQFPGLEIADLQGKVAFDGKYLYGCFKVWSSSSPSAPYKPLAFDLKTLQLN